MLEELDDETLGQLIGLTMIALSDPLPPDDRPDAELRALLDEAQQVLVSRHVFRAVAEPAE